MAVLVAGGWEGFFSSRGNDAVNAFNHPQFTEVPERDVLGTRVSRFLNRDFTNSGIRSMWMQVKVLF
jgi:hypothetical protein